MAVSFFMSASLGPAAATGAAALLRKYVSLFRAPTKSITRKIVNCKMNLGRAHRALWQWWKEKHQLMNYLLSVALDPCLAEGAAFKTFGVTTRSSWCQLIVIHISKIHITPWSECHYQVILASNGCQQKNPTNMKILHIIKSSSTCCPAALPPPSAIDIITGSAFLPSHLWRGILEYWRNIGEEYGL